MVTILLLVVIYFAFISLGLPDTLLGAAWPAIQADWVLPLDAAGLISFIAAGSTVISSFLSGYIVKKLGVGVVTTISCLMTALALLGFSLSSSYIWLLLLAVPLGFGAGSIDSALNNYVTLHFKSHHMNWLHSFWGVGATLGPIIMAGALTNSLTWRSGYRIIAFIQFGLSALLILSLGLWSTHRAIPNQQAAPSKDAPRGKVSIFATKGLAYALATFLLYCTVEISVGLWGSSYFVQIKHVPMDTAANWIAIYYASITIGRFISGFISFKIKNTTMIRMGAIISLGGATLLLVPLPICVSIIPLILMGLGLAPIFPAMIHETPKRFGKNSSQAVIGYQMAFAYMGSTIFPPIFGVIMKNSSMMVLPILLVGFTAFVLICTERLTRLTAR